MAKINKKHLVLNDLLKHCIETNNFTFHNDLVKEISKKQGFGNPFDATKLDSSDKLPLEFKEQDYCILHLGKGRHKFIKGISKLYHHFEPIQESINWQYKKSLLNQYNSSESNILSVANNQRILHDFLFGEDLEFENLDIHLRPKTYFPHRTKKTLEYSFENEKISAEKQQIEIDLTLKFDGIIGIFEAKNGLPKDFNIYQIYHPFLYYYHSGLNFKKIICVYLLRFKNKDKNDALRLYAYTFNEATKLDSIQFLKSKEYVLIKD